MASDDYTPTTDEVRNNMAFGVAMAAYVVPKEQHAGNPDWPIPGYREQAKASFDRWLADHDKEVAARGRYDGFEEAVRRSRYSYEDTDWWVNPYRVADQNGDE